MTQASQLASDNQLLSRTNGLVQPSVSTAQNTLAWDTTGEPFLFSEAAGIQFVLDHSVADPATGLQLVVPASTLDPNPGTGNWDFTFTFNNNRTHPVTVDSVQMDVYDSLGQFYSTQWYVTDGLGPEFPYTFTAWNMDIAASGSYADPGMFIPGNTFFNGTCIMSFVVTDDTTGQSCVIRQVYTLTRGGVPPSPAQTRSLGSVKPTGKTPVVKGR